MNHLKAILAHQLTAWGIRLLDSTPARDQIVEWFLIYLEERADKLVRENPGLTRYL